jgi:hypothetical protein
MNRAIFACLISIAVPRSAASAENVIRHVLVPVGRADSTFSREAIGEKAYPPAPGLNAQLISPAVVLHSAAEVAPEVLQSIRQWNTEGHTPTKNGFVRSTVDPLSVMVSSEAAAQTSTVNGRGYLTATASSVVWSCSIKVENAYQIRLHLENVVLPPSAVMWVYGDRDAPIPFDRDLLDDHGSLWTPSTQGETIYFEIEIPRSGRAASFLIRELLEIVPNATLPLVPNESWCLIDAACITSARMPRIDALRGAIAHLHFVENGSGYVCTGGLITDRNQTHTPYLLTANHCFSDQPAASSLEAYWDYVRPSCGGPIPLRSSLSRSQGATLLTTSTNSDFTLVRLNSVPAGHWFLGWDNTSNLPNGLQLYRISNPFPSDANVPLPQAYSTTILDTASATCPDQLRPRFIYSRFSEGATWGGSSGAPVVYLGPSSTYVIGQLFGTCGPLDATECDSRLMNTDGAFSQTYSSISQWLDASNPVSASCVPGTTTACVLNNRFQVKVRAWNHFASPQYNIDALVKPVTGFASAQSETAFFHFGDANNIELMVKLLNAGNSGIAVLYGVATPFELWLTITDTRSGAIQTYHTARDAMTGQTQWGVFPLEVPSNRTDR